MLDEEAASLCDIAVPKLRLAPFETAIIERYRRRESSVEESLIEMYLAGVSVRRVEDVTELLWGRKHVREQHLPEAQLGRRDDQRVGAGGHRRERRWLPRNPRRGRRRKREQGIWSQTKDGRGIDINSSLQNNLYL